MAQWEHIFYEHRQLLRACLKIREAEIRKKRIDQLVWIYHKTNYENEVHVTDRFAMAKYRKNINKQKKA